MIPSRKDQGRTPDNYWASTVGDQVAHESYLESKWLMMLDFDPQVTAFSRRPLEFVRGVRARGRWDWWPSLSRRRMSGTLRMR
ncbi:hypothetical protein OG196_21435 [Kitasatospora purpeofusca]|uniref:hypothetical protein n=1 Tax=Kitasatospora purpeofusca TaxID=67352 RepID=UPI002E1023E4|nr:hypothetical protein OG196_21435 [Kitasatospora purpeofusca]